MEKVKLGIIGGSGIYEIDGVQDGKWISVDTPFGAPSDEIFTGSLTASTSPFCRAMVVDMFIHPAMFPTGPIFAP